MIGIVASRLRERYRKPAVIIGLDPVTGIVNQNALSPIQVTQTALNPVATQNVSLSANLPATPAAGTGTLASPISSDPPGSTRASKSPAAKIKCGRNSPSRARVRE